MINLLSNAVKFVAAGSGRVTVSLAAGAGELQGRRRRQRAGHRAEEQQTIFEKFRQAGDTMTDKPQGTGLGLPISRQIVEHFGGRLWVESEPGQGAEFVFSLPVGRAPAAAQ